MHKGKIKVSSSQNEGSSFHVYLSSRDDLFTEEEKVSILQEEILHISEEESLGDLEEHLAGDASNPANHVYTVLVVEDNVEMQIFLKDLLQKNYKVSIAENGREGLSHTIEHKPDLIISDIMMPVMDGIEMTKALKKNKLTKHIPLILLTARNTTKSKLKGLQSGAIAYINKPFNPQELVLRVKNFLLAKEDVISQTKTKFISNKTAELPLSKDHEFLTELVDSLNEHVEDKAFRLEQLSEKMGMSYSVIFRKCQEITGKNLVEFFKGIRMKRAALLIVEQGYNISEAGYIVGYKDAKHFSKSFKKEFGTAPFSMKSEGKKIGLQALAKKYDLQSV